MKKNAVQLLNEHEQIIRFFDNLIKSGFGYGGIQTLRVKEWAVKGIESELREV